MFPIVNSQNISKRFGFFAWKLWAYSPISSAFHFRYSGPLLEETVMTKALDEGPKSVELTKVIEWATTELSAFYGIEDHVNAISGYCFKWQKSIILGID